MNKQTIAINSNLIDIEAAMRQLGFWSDNTPTKEALQSSLPFCVDTLSLPQWLQYVFLPRMTSLLEEGATLPESCEIAPMVEEYFRGIGQSPMPLIEAVARLDRCFLG